MAPNMFVLEIVPRLPQEQANTISNENKMKLVFNFFGLKLYQQGGQNINKLT